MCPLVTFLPPYCWCHIYRLSLFLWFAQMHVLQWFLFSPSFVSCILLRFTERFWWSKSFFLISYWRVSFFLNSSRLQYWLKNNRLAIDLGLIEFIYFDDFITALAHSRFFLYPLRHHFHIILHCTFLRAWVVDRN